jgi:hypothetical protein
MGRTMSQQEMMDTVGEGFWSTLGQIVGFVAVMVLAIELGGVT